MMAEDMGVCKPPPRRGPTTTTVHGSVAVKVNRTDIEQIQKTQDAIALAAQYDPECPLWVMSRHRITSASCPLFLLKRTLIPRFACPLSATSGHLWRTSLRKKGKPDLDTGRA